ncbi:TPA: hypothetical protein N0F65_006853 [Lagenidium giganteum]|uniref:BAP29/BAP31 transmembrane domain-containing protein n=1 Tax=Lagenidium giganteum TaxID=4803 RepID=A0AAV2YGH3_9STRA|nr:TPA: hypothetical protein N0F65_006853 [Lagenidium giganteum]
MHSTIFPRGQHWFFQHKMAPNIQQQHVIPTAPQPQILKIDASFVWTSFLAEFQRIQSRLPHPLDRFDDTGKALLQQRVLSLIERQLPITLVLPAFPCKSPNRVDKFGVHLIPSKTESRPKTPWHCCICEDRNGTVHQLELRDVDLVRYELQYKRGRSWGFNARQTTKDPPHDAYGRTKMLLNYLMFWLMCTEAAICLLISLPFGKGMMLSVINFLSSRVGGKDSVAATVANIVLALVTLLFLSDVQTVYKYHSSDTILSDGLRIRLLTAQRDMYISGFSLFLFLLLRLVFLSMESNIKLEKSLGAMKKQAEGASTGYKALFEENETIKKQLEKVQKLLGDSTDGDDKKGEKVDVLAKLLEENAQLETKLESTTKELKSAEAKVEAVKKQAEGQSSAFMKLMDDKAALDKQTELVQVQKDKIETLEQEVKELKKERDALKAQVQDYDFMFADAKKKAL